MSQNNQAITVQLGSLHRVGLAELIDLALRNNPSTQRQWAQARAASAAWGTAEAPYYPRISFDSDNGYQRTIIELPSEVAKLEQWQADPALLITYTLLDFGRRRSSVEAARERSIAANFAFDRAIQDVVFGTQAAFYSLDAARGALIVARQNLRLAQTDFDAVNQRMQLGLSTEPQLLLARERVAEARFELANSRLMVEDAKAQLALALGIAPDRMPEIEGLDNLAVPQSLSSSVETLMEVARRQRPDLAVQSANIRASEADVQNAKSQFYPVAGLSAGYGENNWNFTFQTPRTVQTSQPQYSALLSLRWDIFTGFQHLNQLRQAEATRQASRAALEQLQVDVLAQVWRAYFDFQSSLTKYEYAQSLLTASQESYDANLQTYRQGLSTIVELLTAERDLANARFILIQTKAELLTAYAAVAYAAGQTHAR